MIQVADTTLQKRLEYIEKHTILEVIHGSKAYGTALPTSDTDIKGVCLLPDKRYFIGMQGFEQQDSGYDQDKVIYHLPKFMKLAGNTNPNILEILYGAEENILKLTKLGLKLIDNRDIFLSRKARHTFSGYALSQLKRISGHKRWLDCPATKPSHEEFTHEKTFYVGPLGSQLPAGMKLKKIELALPPEASTEDIAEYYGSKDSEWYKITADVYDKAGYEAKKKDWEHYTRWRNERNEQRAELERKFSYDTKHSAHLVRLLRMGFEILTEGKVLVKRPDAEELLSIRNGAWSYEKIMAYAEEMDLKLAEAEKTSPLPYAPQWDKIEQLQMELIEEALSDAKT